MPGLGASCVYRPHPFTRSPSILRNDGLRMRMASARLTDNIAAPNRLPEADRRSLSGR